MSTYENPNAAIVVVGAAGGLGGAIARRLASDRPGAPLWITYRGDAERAEAVAREIPGARTARCDLHSADDMQRLADEVRAGTDGVATLVHAAVEVATGPALEIGYERFSEVVRSSGLALLGLTAAFDDQLGDGSTILYCTSIGSFRVIPTYSAIGTAKACGEALVRYLAAELAPRGIRVNAISPPPFASQAAQDVVGDLDALMAATDAATPRGRRLDLAEIADLASYLSEPRSSGITGQSILVDGAIFNTWRF
ncbi:MAG: SDR family oxidoreductase [Actinobacteria bacterium]|nr:SDR family oxidoreductase [Actinomycetota bacterium]